MIRSHLGGWTASSPLGRSVGSRLVSLSAVALSLAFGSIGHAAIVTAPPVVAANDSYVVDNGSAPVLGGNLYINGGATKKHAYLRFNVPNSATLTGRPKAPDYTATLKITTVNRPASVAGNIVVSAADNSWQTFTNFSTAPKSTDQLRKASAGFAGEVTLSFDVTAYISGAGSFTFCLTAEGSTADQQFYSNTASDPAKRPQLIIKYEGPPGAGGSYATQIAYFTRDVYNSAGTGALDDGERYQTRYKAANSAGSAGANDINKVGYFDATKPPYCMSTTNSALDNYFALQRCVNEARDARVAVYIPAGTYQINDQVHLIQGLVRMMDNDTAGRIYGERWDSWDFPCVVLGSPTASRTVLEVPAGVTAFGSASNPTAVLNYWNRWSSGGDPYRNQLASHFQAVLNNVDFNLNNNSGAIAVDMPGAQGCSIRNVNVTGTTFFAGFHGLPGPGGLTENISVTGGKYGLWMAQLASGDNSNLGFTPTVVAATFSGQSQHAVRWEANQSGTLVGCKITFNGTDPGASAIYLGDTMALQGNLSLVDTIIYQSSNKPIITGKRSFYLRDVYAQNSDPLASLTNAASGGVSRSAPSGHGTGWIHIQEYYDGSHTLMAPGQTATRVPSFLNRAAAAPADWTIIGITASDIPGDISNATKHRATAMPSWTDSDVANVKDHGVVGNGSTDDSVAVANLFTNAALNGKKLFFPRGEYALGNTIVVPNDRMLFGIDKAYSRLKAIRGGATTSKPLFRCSAGDSSDKLASTRLADLTLLTRQNDNKWFLLDWRVGRYSEVKNVNFDRRHVGGNWGGFPPVSLTGPLVHINSVNGGGRWYTLWNDSDNNQAEHTYRHFKIEGTREPLRIYMLNAETDQNTAQVEIDDVENLDIFGSKWEAKERGNTGTAPVEPMMKWNAVRQARWFGLGGNAAWWVTGADAISITSSTDFLITNQNMQASAGTGGGVGSVAFDWLKDGTFERPRFEQWVMYRVDQAQAFFDKASTGSEDGKIDNGVATASGALAVGDNTSNGAVVSIVSFNTQHIPTNATIKKIVLRLKVSSKTAGLSNLKADFFAGAISGSATLTAGDATATGQAGTACINQAVSAAVVGDWIEFTVGLGGATTLTQLINPGGVTQVRLYMTPDSDGVAEQIGFLSGDDSTVRNRPTLDIWYADPT